MARPLKFCLNLSTKGIEDGFCAIAIIQNSDGEAFCAGADEDFIAGNGGIEKHFRRQKDSAGLSLLRGFPQVPD